MPARSGRWMYSLRGLIMKAIVEHSLEVREMLSPAIGEGKPFEDYHEIKHQIDDLAESFEERGYDTMSYHEELYSYVTDKLEVRFPAYDWEELLNEDYHEVG